MAQKPAHRFAAVCFNVFVTMLFFGARPRCGVAVFGIKRFVERMRPRRGLAADACEGRHAGAKNRDDLEPQSHGRHPWPGLSMKRRGTALGVIPAWGGI